MATVLVYVWSQQACGYNSNIHVAAIFRECRQIRNCLNYDYCWYWVNTLPRATVWLRIVLSKCRNGFNHHRICSPRNTQWESQSTLRITQARDPAFNFIFKRLADFKEADIIHRYQRFVQETYYSLLFHLKLSAKPTGSQIPKFP